MSYNPNNPNGQQTMANSQPVVLASNQSTVPVTDTTNGTKLDSLSTQIGATNETLPVSDTPTTSGLNGLIRRVINNLTVGNTAFGAQADASATTDTGTFSFISLFKRWLSRAPVAIDVDNAVLTNTKVLPTGGRAIDVTAPTPLSVGDAALDVHDNATGAKVVLQGDLNSQYDSVTISENIKRISVEITRPNDTIAYAANDMIYSDAVTGGSLIFSNVVSSLSTSYASGYIVGCKFVGTDPNVIGKRLVLLLYDSGNLTSVDNNPTISGSYPNTETKRICRIDIDNIIDCIGDPSGTADDAVECEQLNLRVPFKLTVSTSFKALLVTKDVFTPTANAKYFVELLISLNP